MASGRERDAQRMRVHITDMSVCHHCKRAGLTAQDAFCPQCGFPQGGTEKQQYMFIVGKRKVLSEIKDNESMLDKGRYFLWIAALLNMVTFSNGNGQVLAGGGIVSAIFIALSFWVKKNPFAAFLTALIVYVSLQLFIALFDPMYVLSGILFKTIIAAAFTYGMYSAKTIENLKKQL